uniref:Uncharacterized protein n=1 Tax=Aegilops tauschii subsp. strangulata TaxID=200361 RepID=A0A453ILC4_AEGTS
MGLVCHGLKRCGNWQDSLRDAKVHSDFIDLT